MLKLKLHKVNTQDQYRKSQLPIHLKAKKNEEKMSPSWGAHVIRSDL